MKLSFSRFTAALAGVGMVAAADHELPITTTDVFVQSGEVSASSANVMARCNKEMDSFASLSIEGFDVDHLNVTDVNVTGATDYTVTFEVTGLESNTMYPYSVTCSDAEGLVGSEPASFKTTPAADEAAAVSFVWVADVAGQGWGRNPDLEVTTVSGEVIKGGYIVFEMMESMNPDFALFQGDMIYADNAIPPVKEIPEAVGGGNWSNNPSKDFVAITVDEFRANWKYNFGDEKMQSFLSKTPVFVTWDDHEVTNNWYPGEILYSDLYPNGTEADLLFNNSLQALYEFNPIVEDSLIYRNQRFGKHLEIFFPDYRSYRDPNPGNDDPEGIAMMGEEQLEWLKQGLLESTATWKIISSHDPFSIVTGGEGDRDSFSQGKPEILGRELELRDLFSFIEMNGITGVVSLTSDVHFTAHVSMDPERAEGNITDFMPLDEFVIGPCHAGAFGPGSVDTSFGAEYEYVRGPGSAGLPGNMPPSAPAYQSFGHASVSEDGILDIKLVTVAGEVQYSKTLLPATEFKLFTTNGPADEQDPEPLVDGQDVVLASINCPKAPYTIEYTNFVATSVRFMINGEMGKCERIAPFTIAGNDGPDYRRFKDWEFEATNTFTAIAYSEENCNGEPMSEDMISINLGACVPLDYGPLSPVADEATGLYLLELPQGFTYTSYGWTGQYMDDGNPTPTDHDGMAVSGVRDNIISLVRNHECSLGEGPLLDLGGEATYGSGAIAGSNTNIEYDMSTHQFVRSYGSLVGIIRPCAGGLTPWESWMSNEENFSVDHDGFTHGWIFDVPAFNLSDAVPIKSAGRFNHEASSVDPETGIVYLTEDVGISGLYKYVMPGAGDKNWTNDIDRLLDGGELFAMAIDGFMGNMTWAETNTTMGMDMRGGFANGDTFPVTWVQVMNPQAPNTEDRSAAFKSADGAAIFTRGEGSWFENGLLYFVSTNGGAMGLGQIWVYDPEAETVTMAYESRDSNDVWAPDNIAISPKGAAILCEDGGSDPKRLIGLDEDGNTFEFAKNIIELNADDLAHIDSVYPGTEANFWDSVVGDETDPTVRRKFSAREWAGATFHEDVLFVNIQSPGVTFAIRGPWNRGIF